MTSSIDLRTALSALARRVAFAADTRQRSPLEDVRRRCVELVLGVDPDEVDRFSPTYRYGGYDALASVIAALEEQTIGASTRDLLRKSERARILNAVLAYPGRNQRALSEQLDVHESNLATYLRELLQEGLVEPSPSEARGRSYALTPWGRKAWITVAASPEGYRVPTDELEQAIRVSELPPPPRTEPALIAKEKFYEKLRNALAAESTEPLLLSTLVTKPLGASGGLAKFHKYAVDQMTKIHRPVRWLIVDDEHSKPFQHLLLESAAKAKVDVVLYRLAEPSEPLPSRQVTEDEGLIYPALPGFAEVVDRKTSRQAWERMCDSATRVEAPVANA